tara:strand:+ start:2380 stop:2847 length:468 start_codon:yes stop_codon:yes gene_type:complete
VFKKLNLVVVGQLKQGLGQQACCHAIAAALMIGLFPIMGFSTLMNTFIAAYFRLNQPVVQVCNWIIAPVKIALIFPFLRLGEWLFQANPFRLSLTEFSTRFFNDFATTTAEFAWTFAHAIAGWLICAPLIYGVIFRISKVLVPKRLASHPSRVAE